MRIVHVVTLVSDDGAYGGPVSVATGQLGELARRGHRVTLVSLWRGRRRGTAPPGRADGVPLRVRRAHGLVPGRGFLGLFHPLLLRDLWREVGAADAVHVHAGRDLVSLAALAVAAARRRRPVVQTHGMVQPRRSPAARLFDAVYVPLLRRARACVVLTEREETGLARVLGAGRGHRPPLVRLPNAVRAVEGARPGPAPSDAAPEVLYLARLHPRKRPEAFVRAASLVLTRRPGVFFTLHGADEGSLPAVRELIDRCRLAPQVAYGGPLDHDAALERIRAADVYVLPSVDEPFPMSVLEALAAGTPVVCTRSCGIAGELLARGAALVTDGSPAALAGAVERLLTDPALRASVAAAGRRAVAERFSLPTLADRLEALYAASVPGP